MKKLVFIMFICLLAGFTAAGQAIINFKGTKVSMDTSKWKLNGADIYTKNTGNTGIGITAPLYKLDVSATANPLRLTGLQAGAATDSVLTVQSGVVRYVSIDRLVTDTGIYKYDGVLSSNRTLTMSGKTLTFATGGTAMNITGLTSGAATDSVVTVNPATGQLRNVSLGRLITDSSIYKYDGTLASNRTLALSGKTLTFATGGTAMNITGLTSGANTDSVVTVNTSTGQLRNVSLGRLIADSSIYKYNGTLTGNRTLTMSGKTLTFVTGGTAFSITGLTSGALTDSLLTVNPSTGRVNRIAISQVSKNDSTTTSNGLTLVGNDAQLGGTLTKKDTIITSATNTLAIKGLQEGSATDSILTVETGTGAIKKIQQFSVRTLTTTATQATTSTTAATINTLSFSAIAGNTYRVRLWLVYSAAATTTGLVLGPNTFSGGNYWYSTSINTSVNTSQQITGYNAANVLSASGSRATTGNLATLDMTVEATSTASVSFQFATEVSGSAITIQANSRLEYEIIN